jgi:hypothetical protein
MSDLDRRQADGRLGFGGAEGVERHAHRAREREGDLAGVLVRRRAVVEAGLERAVGRAGDDDRVVVEEVLAAVAHVAGREDPAVIEQGPLALRHRVERVEEVGELGHDLEEDLRHLGLRARFVVRELVVPRRRALEEDVGHRLREPQAEDARLIARERHRDQIGHHARDLGERRTAVDRRILGLRLHRQLARIELRR